MDVVDASIRTQKTLQKGTAGSGSTFCRAGYYFTGNRLAKLQPRHKQ